MSESTKTMSVRWVDDCLVGVDERELAIILKQIDGLFSVFRLRIAFYNGCPKAVFIEIGHGFSTSTKAREKAEIELDIRDGGTNVF